MFERAVVGARRTSRTKVISQGAVWVWVLLSMVPVLFMVVTALKPKGLAISIPPTWLFQPTVRNFKEVWTGQGGTTSFSTLVMHSAIITGAVTILTTLLATCAGYALTFRTLRNRQFLSSWILSTYMMPPIVAVVPVYFIETRLHLLGSYPGLIVPEISFYLPISTWLIRRGVQEVPIEIEEAAIVDGASRARVFLQMVVPLVLPIIATAAVLTAVLSWNEFLFAASLTRGASQTAPVAVLSFTGMYGTDWSLLSAASVVISAPVIVLALVLRQRLVSGLTFGAVTG